MVHRPTLNHGRKTTGRHATQEYLDANFKDPLLKAILTAQWPDYGAPPLKALLESTQTVAADYFHGGFYPVGGAKEIANSASQVIKEHGGNCLVSHEAVEIIVRDGAACGVR